MIGAERRNEGSEGSYENKPGYWKSVSLDEIRSHDHILTPGRYVGAEEVEDDGTPFEEKMSGLTEKLMEQMSQANDLDAAIKKNLEDLGFGE